MIIKMNLEGQAFEMVRTGSKDVEMRLNDEKRKLMEPGDTIIFTNLITRERLYAKVTTLTRFPSFKELYAAFDKIRLGYMQDESADYRDMYLYYSKAAIQDFGVLAIEMEVVDEPFEAIEGS